jgi:spectinomycin phosphotransferase
MLEKPAVPDEKIIVCLQAEYGLCITRLTFLPLGGNLCTAVYRAITEDGTSYFCKLRCSRFSDISVELPKYLSEQGLSQIIPPLRSTRGQLSAALDEFTLILYPFVEGISGDKVRLSERQWADFGAALHCIHTTDLPSTLAEKMQKEDLSPESRDICSNILHRLDTERFADPVMAGLADYLLPRVGIILDLVRRVERLAHNLAARPLKWVLCHSDIHPGNLFIDSAGALFIVDWDSPILAPKERDLIFVGGGQGYVGITADEEEALFYRYYGSSPIDPLAMAYYRCERSLYDLSVECPRILTSTLNPRDRAKSLETVTWLFLPSGSIEMAQRAADRLSA